MNAAKTKKPRAEQLQFPNLPEPDLCVFGNPIFALCAWMRHVAMAEALKAHADSLWYGKHATSEALTCGLLDARIKASRAADEALEWLLDEGGLLYAFNGTTKIKGLETKGGAL